jgi:hypothetical protein
MRKKDNFGIIKKLPIFNKLAFLDKILWEKWYMLLVVVASSCAINFRVHTSRYPGKRLPKYHWFNRRTVGRSLSLKNPQRFQILGHLNFNPDQVCIPEVPEWLFLFGLSDFFYVTSFESYKCSCFLESIGTKWRSAFQWRCFINDCNLFK